MGRAISSFFGPCFTPAFSLIIYLFCSTLEISFRNTSSFNLRICGCLMIVLILRCDSCDPLLILLVVTLVAVWFLSSNVYDHFSKLGAEINFYHVISCKRQLLSFMQFLQSISDSRQLTLMERNHLSHLTRQLEQFKVLKKLCGCKGLGSSG